MRQAAITTFGEILKAFPQGMPRSTVRPFPAHLQPKTPIQKKRKKTSRIMKADLLTFDQVLRGEHLKKAKKIPPEFHHYKEAAKRAHKKKDGDKDFGHYTEHVKRAHKKKKKMKKARQGYHYGVKEVPSMREQWRTKKRAQRAGGAKAKPYGHKEYMRKTKKGKVVHVPARGFKTLRRHTKHWTADEHRDANDLHLKRADIDQERKKDRRSGHHMRLMDWHQKLASKKEVGKKAKKILKKPKGKSLAFHVRGQG